MYSSARVSCPPHTATRASNRAHCPPNYRSLCCTGNTTNLGTHTFRDRDRTPASRCACGSCDRAYPKEDAACRAGASTRSRHHCALCRCSNDTPCTPNGIARGTHDHESHDETNTNETPSKALSPCICDNTSSSSATDTASDTRHTPCYLRNSKPQK